MSAQHARKGDGESSLEEGRIPKEENSLQGNECFVMSITVLPVMEGLIKNMNPDKDKQAVTQCNAEARKSS